MRRNPDDRLSVHFTPHRTLLRALPAGLALLLLLLSMAAPARAAQPKYQIKLATMAPENSSLMHIFTAMNAELLKETHGQLEFRMYAGFVLGDEADVLRKLRIGLVQAAAFTDTALTDLNPQLRVLQVPFLFNNYREVDYVLGHMQGALKKRFAKKGFVVLGWPELGFIYLMSKQPIAGLADLKGKKVWAQANAPMAQALISKAAVSTVAITAPDVLMALQTNLLDVVYNSPYYAVVTQWYTQLKYFTDLPLSYIGGALLINKRTFDRLPPNLQQTLTRVCAKYTRELVEKTRQDNAEAIRVILQRGMQKVTPTPSQVKTLRKLSHEAMSGLSPRILSQQDLKQVEAELAAYRAGHQETP